ncbi:MAG TPA: response regulator transcription factor [Bacteroidia bacterium]|nr:response regulator transcription factor [Bacteroidia bacterium]HNS11214.1 response regulator transcription factor [Bacteroidia bacterium]
MTGSNLLLVSEPSAEINLLTHTLSAKGFNVKLLNQFSDSLKFIEDQNPGIILLDTLNKNVACFELCFLIKSNNFTRNMQVLILSDDQDEKTEIDAFTAGADDFIIRPLRPKAVVQRILTRLNSNSQVISIKPNNKTNTRLRIDKESYTVYLNNELVHLSKKEFDLLHLLGSSSGKVFTRDEIFEKVWKRKASLNDRTIDVHVRRLRKKLGEHFISTQKGIGYRFNS